MAEIKKIVQLQDENGLFIYPTTTLEAIAGSNTLRDNFVQKIGDTMSGPLQATGFIGPLTGNATSADKLNTDKGSTSNPVYFLNGVPVACTGTTVPTGGSTGQALIKDSNGNAVWQKIVALPDGGSQNQILIKNSNTNGDAAWGNNAPTASKLATARSIGLSGDVSGSANFDGSAGITISTTVADNSHNHTWSNISDRASCTINTSGTITGSKVYGAVWNDYAEYRNQQEIIEPGYCVASADSGQVYKTTEKFQACDGIVSDTYGFAIGETDECKTPLAVAGRVLAYYSGNREDYHAGDTVCAGPEGKVCKMTREEIREWPDRIIGIVSEIPEYETWGSGNIKVNNRIWIKVK